MAFQVIKTVEFHILKLNQVSIKDTAAQDTLRITKA